MDTKKTLGFLVTVNGAIAATIIQTDLAVGRAEADKIVAGLIIAAKKGQTLTDCTLIEIKRWCAGDGLNGNSGTVAAWQVQAPRGVSVDEFIRAGEVRGYW